MLDSKWVILIVAVLILLAVFLATRYSVYINFAHITTIIFVLVVVGISFVVYKAFRRGWIGSIRISDKFVSMEEAQKYALQWWKTNLNEDMQLVGRGVRKYFSSKHGGKLFYGFLLRRTDEENRERFGKVIVSTGPLNIADWDTEIDPKSDVVNEINPFHDFSFYEFGSAVSDPVAEPWHDIYGYYRRPAPAAQINIGGNKVDTFEEEENK